MKRTLPLTALAAAALVAAGCGSSSNNNNNKSSSNAPATPAVSKTPVSKTPATPSSGPVKVALTEWAIKPSVNVLKAGKVKFVVTNAGKTIHEMVIIRTNKHAASLGTGSRISEKGSIGEVSEFAAGKTITKTFNLKPGHYALVCNVPGHYMSGMHADITVQ